MFCDLTILTLFTSPSEDALAFSEFDSCITTLLFVWFVLIKHKDQAQGINLIMIVY